MVVKNELNVQIINIPCPDYMRDRTIPCFLNQFIALKVQFCSRGNLGLADNWKWKRQFSLLGRDFTLFQNLCSVDVMTWEHCVVHYPCDICEYNFDQLYTKKMEFELENPPLQNCEQYFFRHQVLMMKKVQISQKGMWCVSFWRLVSAKTSNAQNGHKKSVWYLNGRTQPISANSFKPNVVFDNSRNCNVR